MRAGIAASGIRPAYDYMWTPDDLAPGTPLNQVPGWVAAGGYTIATDDVGGTYLYHMMSAGLNNNSYPAAWLTPGVLTDVDATAEVWGVATETHIRIGPQVRRAADNDYRSYQALIVGSTLRIYLQGPEHTLGNQRTELASATLPITPSHMDRWYIRLQAIGTTLKAKAWPKQTPEPETWLASVEDATHTSGYVGFTGFGRSSESRAAWSLRVTDLAS